MEAAERELQRADLWSRGQSDRVRAWKPARLDRGPERNVPLATHYGTARLNSPNDLVVRSDGSVYFTDPPYGIPDGERELPHNGVYRVTPAGEIELLVPDMGRPNGLAFSPAEDVLYIDDSERRQIRAYDVQPDGSLLGGRIWAHMDYPTQAARTA